MSDSEVVTNGSQSLARMVAPDYREAKRVQHRLEQADLCMHSPDQGIKKRVMSMGCE